MNTACLRLLIFLFLPSSCSLFVRSLATLLELLFLFLFPRWFSLYPPWLLSSLFFLSRSLRLSFGSSFLSASRQLDAFLTTRRTHSEGTTVELYSAAATTIVSSSVRWKGDKQRRCKRVAPFHFCLTSNLLRRCLMKET